MIGTYFSLSGLLTLYVIFTYAKDISVFPEHMLDSLEHKKLLDMVSTVIESVLCSYYASSSVLTYSISKVLLGKNIKRQLVKKRTTQKRCRSIKQGKKHAKNYI